MFDENDLMPISALQHLLFCDRQCALIHVDQIWSENRLTAEGRIFHERVHEADAETRGNVRIVRGLRLRSLRLGLAGIADVVEFHRDPRGLVLEGLGGRWSVMPVEYKRGRPKANACDEVQLCAQAMCLEEMLTCATPSGALFYGKTRRRKPVVFDVAMRNAVEEAAARVHELVKAGRIPPAVYEKKCDSCSLLNTCLPKLHASAKHYLASAIRDDHS